MNGNDNHGSQRLDSEELFSTPVRASATTSDRPRPPAASTAVLAAYAATSFGLSLTILTPALFGLAYKVQTLAPGSKEAALGIIAGIGALVGMVAGPVIGVISDRTRLAWGRRRPYLVAGIVIAAGGATVIATATSLSGILVGWVIAQLGHGCLGAAIVPVVAESVPAVSRGKAAALSGVATQLAGVLATLMGSLLTGNQLLLFLSPVAVLAVTAVFFIATIPDSPAAATERPPLGEFVKQLYFDPRAHPDFAFVWLSQWLMQISMNFFSTYQLYFILDRLALTPEVAGQKLAVVGGIGVVVATTSAAVSGAVSDRIRRRKPLIYIAAAFIATGLVIVGLTPNIVGYAIGAIAILLGAGMFGAVQMALATDVMPNRDTEAGRYTGVLSVASNMPSAVAPMLAPVILAIGGPSNYTALFFSAAATALGAAVFVGRVHAR